MKTIKTLAMLFAAVAFLAAGFTSCTEEGTNGPEVDLTELNAAIADCEAVLATATSEDFPEEAINTFKATVDAAKAAAAGSTLNQTAINNLVAQLKAAKDAFLQTEFGAIPADALTMALTFDEGEGTTLKTTGKYQWTAELKKGETDIFGTETDLPKFVDGKVGKAISLTNGAHLQINDYQALALEGKELSIATWVKLNNTRPGNYIVSYNYWNTWKFQLQSENKPFFTLATENGITDMDNETPESVKNGEWAHLVVTANTNKGEVSFYVNGALTKTWTVTERPALVGAIKPYANKLPLMIGTHTTVAEATAAWDWDWAKTPEGWDWLDGSLDEFKIYNIALTEGQVAKLYSNEN